MRVKKGFWYGLAYGYSEKGPWNSNIWRFVGRCVLGLFAWPFMLSCLGFVYFIGFFVAKKPNFESGSYNNAFIPYKRWPKLFGHNVWPILIIAIAIITDIATSSFDSLKGLGLTVLLFIVIVGIMIFIGWIEDLCERLGNSTKLRLLTKYIKTKISMPIEFIDEDETHSS